MRPNPTLADLPLRPELVGEEPYGAPQLDVPVCLNVNENPYPPSAATLTDMAEAIRAAAYHRYPDREFTRLRGQLADYLGHGLGVENVWAANGSNEVMTHVLGAFGGPGTARAVVHAHLLDVPRVRPQHPHRLRHRARAAPTSPSTPELVLDAIAEHDPSVVLITTPNNPTGTTTPLAVVEEVLAGTDAIVVVDEAYQEFSRTPGPRRSPCCRGSATSS